MWFSHCILFGACYLFIQLHLYSVCCGSNSMAISFATFLLFLRNYLSTLNVPDTLLGYKNIIVQRKKKCDPSSQLPLVWWRRQSLFNYHCDGCYQGRTRRSYPFRSVRMLLKSRSSQTLKDESLVEM